MTARSSTGRLPGGAWLWRPLIGATLSQVVLGIIRPTISYAGINAGADGFEIGILAAAFAVIPMIIALPVGSLAGRWKHLGLLPLASAIVLVVACALAATATSLPTLTVAAMLLGIGNLGVLLGAQSWILRSVSPSRYTGEFGMMTAGMSLGQAIGPLCAGLLIEVGGLDGAGISLAFWLAAGVSVLLASCFMTSTSRSYASDQSEASLSPIGILKTRGLVRYIVVSAAVLTSVDILTIYLPMVGAKAGISPALIGMMLAVRGLSSMLSRLSLGRLARCMGQSQLIVASVGGAALCMIVVAFVPSVWALFLALAIGGFFLGIGQPITMTAVATALSERARSNGLAMRLLGNRIAQTAVPLISGTFTTQLGLNAVFLVQVLGLATSAIWEIAALSRDAPE